MSPKRVTLVGLFAVGLLISGYAAVGANHKTPIKRYKIVVYNGDKIDINSPCFSREIEFTRQSQEFKLRGFEFEWRKHEDGGSSFKYTFQTDDTDKFKSAEGEVWSIGEFGGLSALINARRVSPENALNAYHLYVSPVSR